MKLLAACLLATILATCSTAQLNEFRDSTDVSIGVTGDGITARAGTKNGRKFVGVDVDAKEVKRVIDQR